MMQVYSGYEEEWSLVIFGNTGAVGDSHTRQIK